MGGFFKFLFVFLFYGAVWFGLFSFQLNKDDTLFTYITKTLKLTDDNPANHRIKSKEINREGVIDALTGAFK